MLSEETKKLIRDVFRTGTPKITLSNPIRKSGKYFRITVLPKQAKGGLFYQFSMYYEDKVEHVNLGAAEAAEKLLALLSEGYKLCDIFAGETNYKILSGKSSSRVIKSWAEAPAREIKPHNDAKNYAIPEGEPVPWLVSLGIMSAEGRVLSHGQKKFRQINHFLEIISHVAGRIPDGAAIIDFGCGKSYLTFAMYYFFNILMNRRVTITGLDLKRDVVENCQRLADEFGFSGLNFVCGDIADYRGENGKADMVVSLHACDTATDYAIFNAISWGARVILAVPCCQHELNGQIKNPDFGLIFRHGVLKERFSALLTDALRAAILDAAGYKTSVAEFIDLEHTPKNIMIRAVKNEKAAPDEKKRARAKELMDMFGVSPSLYGLIFAAKGTEGAKAAPRFRG